MLDQVLFEMEVYGFTIIPEVLSCEKIKSLRDSFIKCLKKTGSETNFLGKALHVSNLPTQDKSFFQIIDNPKILPILEQLLGKNLILGSLNGRVVRPGDGYQKLHSDINQDLLNPVSPVMCNTVWMLDDFSPENGSTCIVPGSHKSGMSGPPDGYNIKHIYQVSASAGSFLVFNGQCWHGGGENKSANNRHALFGHYRKNSMIFQADPHDDFPKNWFKDLSIRQRELLRMENGVGVPHSADYHFNLSFSQGGKIK